MITALCGVTAIAGELAGLLWIAAWHATAPAPGIRLTRRGYFDPRPECAPTLIDHFRRPLWLPGVPLDGEDPEFAAAVLAVRENLRRQREQEAGPR